MQAVAAPGAADVGAPAGTVRDPLARGPTAPSKAASPDANGPWAQKRTMPQGDATDCPRDVDHNAEHPAA
jgi:hypothetical protein